jgi:hypothetical protein
MSTMRSFHTAHNLFLDPHSAVGVSAALTPAIQKLLLAEGAVASGVICVLTAHPAKFGTTSQRAGLPVQTISRIERLRALPRRFRELKAVPPGGEYRGGGADAEYRGGGADSQYRRGEPGWEYRGEQPGGQYREGGPDGEYRVGEPGSQYRGGGPR